MHLIVVGRLVPKTTKLHTDGVSRWMRGDISLNNASRSALTKIGQRVMPFTLVYDKALPTNDVIMLGLVSSYTFPDSGRVWKTLDIDTVITQDSPILSALNVSFREAVDLIARGDTEFMEKLGSVKLIVKKQITDILGTKNQFADTLLEMFDVHAYEKLCQDPWDMIHALPYYTVAHADKVAESVGLSLEDPKRFNAIFTQLLDREFSKHANTYMNENSFIAFYWLNFSETMTLEEYIQLSQVADSPIIKSDIGYHPSKLYRAESASYRYLEQAVMGEPQEPELHLEEAQNVLNTLDIQLTPEQEHALIKALSAPLHIITGGPGTGKTTILSAILQKMQNLTGVPVNSPTSPFLLVAPTGKAAARMQEQTGVIAKTIHSAFNIKPGYGIYNIDNAVEKFENIRYIIVDEASMLDSAVFGDMCRVFARMTHRPKLLLVGDVDQLPPVQSGQVFYDVITFLRNAHPEMITELTEVKRQADGSNIPELASYIRKGQFPPQEWFIGKSDTLPITSKMTNFGDKLCSTLQNLEDHEMDKVQILTPYRSGPNPDTIHGINHLVAPLFNPQSPDDMLVGYGNPPRQFRVGDKVVNRVNFSPTIVNGSIGTITYIDDSSNDLFDWSISVSFGDEIKEYLYETWIALEPAYAITIHSSQGSEYDTVIVVTMRSANPDFLTRNLLYTAITRASKNVILMGDYNTFVRIAQTPQPPRQTALSVWLSQLQSKED